MFSGVMKHRTACTALLVDAKGG